MLDSWSSSNILQPSSLLITVVVAVVCHKLVAVYKCKHAMNFLPGRTFLVSPATVLGGFVLPRVQGICPGKNFNYVNKFSEYEALGLGVYRMTSILPWVENFLLLADAEAIKEVTSSRARFPKPVDMYTSLLFFGHNIVASEGDMWKKYRKISAPAFSERNNRMVWDEAVMIIEGLFRDVWGDKKVVEVDHAVDITLPFALFVIGAAGFGQRMSWKDTEVRPDGHRLSFKQALHSVAHDVFIKLSVPNWAMGLTEKTRNAQTAFEELEQYMLEMINDRATGIAEGKNDLFSNLMASNASDDGPNAMSARELQGNIFIFLLAGHETTAHTLAFALGLLAIHQEEQEKIYQQIRSVLPDGGVPAYDDRNKLNRCVAAYYETLRLVPPVTSIPKRSAEDTTITVRDFQGNKVAVTVPKGTHISLDVAGLHYNPQHWEAPHEFQPDRFLKAYNRDAFLPFSDGARSCIGRKFFEAEGISALTMILSRYKITLKEEPEFANETLAERQARILQGEPGITVTPIRIPLVFSRRD